MNRRTWWGLLLVVGVIAVVAGIWMVGLVPAHCVGALTADGTGNVATVSVNSAQLGTHLAYGDETGAHYSRTRLTWGVISTVWGWVVLVGILFAGLSPRLSAFASRLTGHRFGGVPQYVILLTLITTLAALPLTYFRGFIIEHDFGLSNLTQWMWVEEYLKDVGLTVVMNLFIFVPIYLFIRRWPRRWWLPYGGLMVVFAVITAALSPLVITPLYNHFEPLPDKALKSEIVALAERGGVPVADVVQIDMSRQTKTANAYFTGIGLTQRIVLGDTLLANFTEEEMLTIVAHEMGHQVHNDLWRSLGVGTVLLLVGAYLLYRAATAMVVNFGSRIGLRGLADGASLPLLLLLVGVISFAVQPLEYSFSRYIEHQADVYALDLTQNGLVYAAALGKLGALNLSDPDPPAWVVITFYTHPPINERIKLARDYVPLP